MTGKEYSVRLEALSDAEFVDEVFDNIDAANQSRTFSPADARARQCYDEAVRRNRVTLYQRGFKAAYAKAKGDAQYRKASAVLSGGRQSR